ncbi:uncharacterized protein [Miscanthus floridulus]|uniref:uncharacterized protein n=1 Tax=Miscanthus floridulus TaxID=154761 RepID=UPI003458565D
MEWPARPVGARGELPGGQGAREQGLASRELAGRGMAAREQGAPGVACWPPGWPAGGRASRDLAGAVGDAAVEGGARVRERHGRGGGGRGGAAGEGRPAGRGRGGAAGEGHGRQGRPRGAVGEGAGEGRGRGWPAWLFGAAPRAPGGASAGWPVGLGAAPAAARVRGGGGGTVGGRAYGEASRLRAQRLARAAVGRPWVGAGLSAAATGGVAGRAFQAVGGRGSGGCAEEVPERVGQARRAGHRSGRHGRRRCSRCGAGEGLGGRGGDKALVGRLWAF